MKLYVIKIDKKVVFLFLLISCYSLFCLLYIVPSSKWLHFESSYIVVISCWRKGHQKNSKRNRVCFPYRSTIEHQIYTDNDVA